MVPYKYNYYIGRSLPVLFMPGYIDPANGSRLSDVSDFYISVNFDIEEYSSLFINYTGYLDIIFYDANDAFIKSISIEANLDNKIIDIPKNAKWVAFNFKADNNEFKGNLKANSMFIYGLVSCIPHYKELNKKYAKESNQEFFRISLDGKITLFGLDYDFITNSNLEDNLVFLLEYAEAIYYKGAFTITDCKLDYSKKSCELKLTTLDDYNVLLDKYENEYDLLKIAPAITRNIKMHKRPIQQVYISGGSSISYFFGGTYWEGDVTEVINDHKALVEKYGFSYIMAANELQIKDADEIDPDLNGVYAGINGEYTSKNNKYKITFSAPPNEYGQQTFAHVVITRVSDGEKVYKSFVPYGGAWGFETEGYRYFDPGVTKEISFVKFSGAPTKILFNADVFLYKVYQRILCDVEQFYDGSTLKDTLEIPLDDFVTDNRNYRRCVGSHTGQFIITPQTSTEPTKYGLNDYGEYFTNNFAGPWAYRPLPVCRKSWVNASLWYCQASIDEYKELEGKLSKEFYLKDSYSIGAIIKALLNKIDPTISHEETADYSKFLYAEDKPLGIDEQAFYVYITPKSNILKSEYDQPAQKAEITFKALMEMLRDCFKCYWYIEDKKLKIEHISFFLNGGTYNTENVNFFNYKDIVDRFNKKFVHYFQSEITYDKADLTARYEFAWMDDVTELFTGPSVDIKSNYVKKDKTDSVNISKFSSDIDFMLFNANDFSSDGFALLCPIKKDGLLEIPITKEYLKDDYQYYWALPQNFYASFKYLLRYYMYDMPAEKLAYDEGIIYKPINIKYCMQHTIQFQIASNFDISKLIKTDIATGRIKEINVNINTRLANIDIQYRPFVKK